MSMHQPAPPLSDAQRHEARYEHNRHSWDSRQPSQAYQPQGHFQIQARPESRPQTQAQPQPTVSNFWDEEGSDSDVSRTLDMEAPVNRILSPVATPRTLPPLSHPLESLDQVDARLIDLERIDEHNDKKLDKLQAKRKRKDDRIRHRRDLEDEKIRAVHAARDRKDARLNARRAREDAAFKKAERDLEEESTILRRRKKELKRGFPVEDSAPNGRSSTNNASISPPIPSRYGVPPPAKRHQSGPPGQNDSPVQAPTRPLQTGPPQHGQHQQPYQFYQPNNTPYNVPYHHNAPHPPGQLPPGQLPPGQLPPGPQPQGQYSQNAYHAQPSAPPSATTGPASSPQLTSAPREAQPKLNGYNAPSPAPGPSPLGPPAPIGVDTKPPPISNSSVYDTRPPTNSGFTSVNVPQASGFATINARAPTYATTPPNRTKTELKHVGNPTPKSEPSRGGPVRSPNLTPTSVGGLALNKRTPSTTHPYQMSEAFANRHHHCERTDELNRGIWTSYGPNGTRDMPTGPPVEMYLRCNHDECRRIDWRTVHGLQCHIVKNHEQPKGTIGSLEKALDRYGVTVSKIEEYEREHGRGSAGQMADPKNLKIKNKTREMRRNGASSPTTNPPGQSSFSTPTTGQANSYSSSVTPLSGSMISNSHVSVRQIPSSATDRPLEEQRPTHLNTFQQGNKYPGQHNDQAVIKTWSTYTPPGLEKLKSDSEVRDAPPLNSSSLYRPSDLQSGPTPVTNAVPAAASPPSRADPALEATVELTVPSRTEEKVNSTAPSPEIPNAPVEAAPASPASEPADRTQKVESLPETGAAATTEIKEKDTSESNLAPELPEIADEIVVEPRTVSEADKVTEAAKAAAADEEPINSVSTAPTTPARPRSTRKESMSVARSEAKDKEDVAESKPSVMASPSLPKVGRASRRVSVATTTTNNTTGPSLDGEDSGGEGEKDGGNSKAGDRAEKPKSLRRNAGGRFARRKQ